MLKHVLIAVVTLALVALGGCKKDEAKTGDAEAAPASSKKKAAPAKPAAAEAVVASPVAPIFDVPLKTLDGKDGKLADYKGKALLVVNVASKCGLTPQYATLEKLQKKYAAKGFTVLGFPCNQFGGQEPGSSEEIATFCSKTYGVTFPMFEKLEVNGDGRHPIYQELTKIKDARGKAGDIQWNFEKFVISSDGKTVTRFRPKTVPDAPEVISAIEAGLPKS